MLKLLFLMGLLMACTALRAADYKLMCSIKETGAGKAAAAYKIWLEFNIEPRYFKHFVREGKSFKRVRDGFPQDVNDTRILIINDGLIQEHYDRTGKKYFYKNDITGTELNGDCVPSKDR